MAVRWVSNGHASMQISVVACRVEQSAIEQMGGWNGTVLARHYLHLFPPKALLAVGKHPTICRAARAM